MNREKKKEKKREAILTAALNEFSTKRFDEVKLDEVAAKAGVGKGTLYLYFDSKEDLFVKMALMGVEKMAARMREVTVLDTDFRDRFFMFGREIGEFVYARLIMFNLMHQIQSEAIREEFIDQHKALVCAARGFLQSGMDEGILRSDCTVADLHCLLIGPLLFRVRLNLLNHDSIEIDTILNLCWSAIVCEGEKK